MLPGSIAPPCCLVVQLNEVHDELHVIAMGEDAKTEDAFMKTIAARRQAEEEAYRFQNRGPPQNGASLLLSLVSVMHNIARSIVAFLPSPFFLFFLICCFNAPPSTAAAMQDWVKAKTRKAEMLRNARK